MTDHGIPAPPQPRDTDEEHHSIARMILRSSRPLMAGLGAFAIFMLVQSGVFSLKTEDMALVARSPFSGINLVYGMLFASLCTVFTATYLYLGELDEIKDRARRTGGFRQIRWAKMILKSSLVLIAAMIIVILLFPQLFQQSNDCSFRALHARAKWHDIGVGVLFTAFIIADWLTFRGLRATLDEARTDDRSLKRVAIAKDFASQQLWLIDVPVLFGAAVALVIVYFAAAVNQWDTNLFHVSGQVQEYLARTRSTALLTCAERPMSLQEFQESVVRIFTAGIAMGYLAAHVLMSQFVFIALTAFYSARLSALDKPDQHGAHAA